MIERIEEFCANLNCGPLARPVHTDIPHERQIEIGLPGAIHNPGGTVAEVRAYAIFAHDHRRCEAGSVEITAEPGRRDICAPDRASPICAPTAAGPGGCCSVRGAKERVRRAKFLGLFRGLGLPAREQGWPDTASEVARL